MLLYNDWWLIIQLKPKITRDKFSHIRHVFKILNIFFRNTNAPLFMMWQFLFKNARNTHAFPFNSSLNGMERGIYIHFLLCFVRFYYLLKFVERKLIEWFNWKKIKLINALSFFSQVAMERINWEIIVVNISLFLDKVQI